MKLYKIRVTGDVLETAAATRRVNVDGLVLTFGREPVYVQADELPQQLASDPYLRIEAVESTPLGADVIDLKSERVQEPTADSPELPSPAADGLPGDVDTDLKSERVQKPAASPSPGPAATPAPTIRKRA